MYKVNTSFVDKQALLRILRISNLRLTFPAPFPKLGSAGLHGTLQWIFQSSDELPMLYLINCLLFLYAEHDAPQDQPNHPYLPLQLVGVSLISTLIYYRFQQIYFVFLTIFTSEIIALTIWSYKILNSKDNRISLTAKNLFKLSNFNLICVGTPVWIFDMLNCKRVITFSNKLPGFFKGLTPHVV